MGLLSKEEEEQYTKAIYNDRLKKLLKIKYDIESLSNYINKLKSNFFDNDLNHLSESELLRFLYAVSIYIVRNKDMQDVADYLGINENMLIYNSIAEISLTIERLIGYRTLLLKKAKINGITNVEIAGNDYYVFLDSDMYHFKKIATLLDGIRNLSNYKILMSGAESTNCHNYNALYGILFNRGVFVTGNLESLFKNTFFSHSWIEYNGNCLVPNLNYSMNQDEYYRLTNAKDMVRIPMSRLKEDFEQILQKDPDLILYEYCKDPDGIMKRLTKI